ncbi:SpoIIE family protein phosphatase [Algisphaera agarilytica]|uniref:Serine phosphatase RsbU (Regulator of sigma subunit) n=1 Tax=Algisphaera agarilytica TaxID=1385975 RepID=A0A7X0H5J6_9BACT|nr:SpoIIE family protein phosphatase [Algisphaera agarilytica]MBB6429634.1 serine phosphatase RsbU (regulator of sigma subunit) [Algisphaera agarilytica]
MRALDEPVLTLGRSSKNQLHLDDPGVSRRHATLTAEPDVASPDAWRLNDLESRNGTRVNGQAVSEVLLSNGDTLEVGPYVLTLGVLNESGDWSTKPSAESTPSTWDDKPVTVVDDHTANLSRLANVGRPKVDAQQLRSVQTLGSDLLSLESPEARRQRLCEFIIEPVMQGQHAAVLRIPAILQTNGWTKPQMLVDPVSCGETDQDFYISRSLLDAVRDSGEAVMATRSGLEVDGNVDDDAPVVELSIAPETQQASVIGCPLPNAAETGNAWGRPESANSDTLGPGDDAAGEIDVLYAVLPDRCGTGEWLALTALAVEQFDLVERAWRAREAAEEQARTQAMLSKARKVQLALVPEAPTVPGLELSLHFEPCYSVGGDYLDVVTLPDGRSLLLVMDVCGKGMAAALISSSLHTFIHARVHTASSVAELINALNLYLCDTMTDSSFVTGIALAIDPATGQVECVNAGHPPAILSYPSADLAYSEHSNNVPLGLLPEPLSAHTFELAPDTVLAIYSDGLTEIVADDGHWIGHEGLAEQLTGAMRDTMDDPVADLSAVREKLNQRLATIQAGSPPDDDMTFLLARRA